MAALVLTAGWVLDALATLWMLFILIRILTGWLLPSSGASRGGLWAWAGRLVEVPVNVVRRTIPTQYRTMDFAPWLTLLFIVLIKTFIFRAMIYWGMLHK